MPGVQMLGAPINSTRQISPLEDAGNDSALGMIENCGSERQVRRPHETLLIFDSMTVDRPFRSDDCVERAAGIRQSTDLGVKRGIERQFPIMPPATGDSNRTVGVFENRHSPQAPTTRKRTLVIQQRSSRLTGSIEMRCRFPVATLVAHRQPMGSSPFSNSPARGNLWIAESILSRLLRCSRSRCRSVWPSEAIVVKVTRQVPCPRVPRLLHGVM